MNQDGVIWRLVWQLLAALAGAITALSFRPFKRMSGFEIALSVLVGTSFATFVGPLVVSWIFVHQTDPRLEGSTYYLMATGSNVLIPLMVRKLAQMIGVSPEEEAK